MGLPISFDRAPLMLSLFVQELVYVQFDEWWGGSEGRNKGSKRVIIKMMILTVMIMIMITMMLTVGRILMFLMSWHHTDGHSAERHNAKTIPGPYPRLSASLLDAVQISQCMLFGDWVDLWLCGGGDGGRWGHWCWRRVLEKRLSLEYLDLHGLACLWTSSFGKQIRQFFLVKSIV